MKNLLIIYPHWVPSNLAGVHRPRLIANFLPDLGWHPIILTVKQEYYEEAPDPYINRTASNLIEVIYTKAFKVGKPRLIGDIGLRAFVQLYSKALELIKSRKIDFIWIPIPSFYTALLGRFLYEHVGIPYGIDYIDPWVRDISNRKNLRAMLSLITAKVMEPIAVRKASLISGVSTAYYEPVLRRNFSKTEILHVGMPYGFDPNDHKHKLESVKFPWNNEKDIKPIVYAGAFLPNSHLFLKALFKAVKELMNDGDWDSSYKMYFLGTGKYPGTTIMEYANRIGVEDNVCEIRDRFSFLEVLNFLSSSEAVMVIGSIEKHYTASKTFQALLSERPVLAAFHTYSSAVNVLQECKADEYLIKYSDGMDENILTEQFKIKLNSLLRGTTNWAPDLSKLEKYSAKASALALVNKLNELV